MSTTLFLEAFGQLSGPATVDSGKKTSTASSENEPN